MLALSVDRVLYQGKHDGDVDAFIKNVRSPVNAEIEVAVDKLQQWQNRVAPPTTNEYPLRAFCNHYMKLKGDLKKQYPNENRNVDVCGLIGIRSN